MKTAIELAREIGFHSAVILWIYSGKESALCDSEVKELRNIERLVEAAVAQEREECAKIAEDSEYIVDGRGYYDQLGDANATARNITAAIRARNNH